MRKAIIALILLLVAAPVLAEDLVYRNGTLTIRISDSPCTSEVLGTAIKGMDAVGPVKAAQVMIRQQRLAACWALDADGDVLLVDQQGDGGFMPREWFKRDHGV
jgi:hypothetical protein